MKVLLQSIGLALQFFTIIPLKRELPLTRRHVTMMFMLLASIGLLIGVLAAGVHVIVSQTSWQPLTQAFFTMLALVVLTGGLHIDGLIDTGDAFFSYRDPVRRLSILDDPRVGAFGVLTVLTWLVTKLVVLQQLYADHVLAVWMLILLPIVTRSMMALFFTTTPCAKEKGLAHFFKTTSNGRYILVGYSFITMIVLGIFTWWTASIVPLILISIALLATMWYRSFAIKNFGGLSGDLLGAWIEGLEVILWLVILFVYM